MGLGFAGAGCGSEVAEEFVLLAPVHLRGPFADALLVSPLFGHGQGDAEVQHGVGGGGGGRRGCRGVLFLGAVLGIQLLTGVTGGGSCQGWHGALGGRLGQGFRTVLLLDLPIGNGLRQGTWMGKRRAQVSPKLWMEQEAEAGAVGLGRPLDLVPQGQRLSLLTATHYSTLDISTTQQPQTM